jgi:hypothetical protein
VVNSIRTGKGPVGWLGFARLGDGPPYALYPIDAAGQPLCRISQVAALRNPELLANDLQTGGFKGIRPKR